MSTTTKYMWLIYEHKIWCRHHSTHITFFIWTFDFLHQEQKFNSTDILRLFFALIPNLFHNPFSLRKRCLNLIWNANISKLARIRFLHLSKKHVRCTILHSVYDWIFKEIDTISTERGLKWKIMKKFIFDLY